MAACGLPCSIPNHAQKPRTLEKLFGPRETRYNISTFCETHTHSCETLTLKPSQNQESSVIVTRGRGGSHGAGRGRLRANGPAPCNVSRISIRNLDSSTIICAILTLKLPQYPELRGKKLKCNSSISGLEVKCDRSSALDPLTVRFRSNFEEPLVRS